MYDLPAKTAPLIWSLRHLLCPICLIRDLIHAFRLRSRCTAIHLRRLRRGSPLRCLPCFLLAAPADFSISGKVWSYSPDAWLRAVPPAQNCEPEISGHTAVGDRQPNRVAHDFREIRAKTPCLIRTSEAPIASWVWPFYRWSIKVHLARLDIPSYTRLYSSRSWLFFALFSQGRGGDTASRSPTWRISPACSGKCPVAALFPTSEELHLRGENKSSSGNTNNHHRCHCHLSYQHRHHHDSNNDGDGDRDLEDDGGDGEWGGGDMIIIMIVMMMVMMAMAGDGEWWSWWGWWWWSWSWWWWWKWWWWWSWTWWW